MNKLETAGCILANTPMLLGLLRGRLRAVVMNLLAYMPLLVPFWMWSVKGVSIDAMLLVYLGVFFSLPLWCLALYWGVTGHNKSLADI